MIKKYFGFGSGPGHSLLCCEKKLKCPFIITSADTVVLENISSPNQNWMGVAPIKIHQIFVLFKQMEILLLE